MNYEDFENRIFTEIENDDKNLLNTIEDYQDIIILYLDKTDKSEYIKNFITKLNNIIINFHSTLFDLKCKKLKLIEQVLKHKIFSKVLAEFRESDVLIQACKNENIDSSNWLLTMNIDPYIKDENGMTALMYAVESSKLSSVVDYLIKDADNICLIDNNNENALFHALNNSYAFRKLLDSRIDINHQNKDNNSVLMLCCKDGNNPNIKMLIDKRDNINYNLVNNDKWTALMYLVENGNYSMLRNFNFEKVDLNFKNEYNESAVSVLIKNFDKIYTTGKINSILNYVHILDILIKNNCNLNIDIDEDGNTPIMFFMMVEDYYTTNYLIDNYKDLDISIKNKHGISATFLTLYINKSQINLLTKLFNHKTFDYEYVDQYNNNLLIHSIVRNNYEYFKKILSKNSKALHQVNHKNENALIICTKLNCKKIYYKCDFEETYNQQDYLGNTAAHYAIKTKNMYIINLIAYNKGDFYIKNNEGKPALNPDTVPNEPIEESILKIINNPIKPFDMHIKMKKKKIKSFFSTKKKSADDEKCDEYIRRYQEEYAYLLNIPIKYPPINKYSIKTKLNDIYNGSDDHEPLLKSS